MQADTDPVFENENDAPAFERLLDIAQGPIVRDRKTLLNTRNRSLSHTGDLSELILRQIEPSSRRSDLWAVKHKLASIWTNVSK